MSEKVDSKLTEEAFRTANRLLIDKNDIALTLIAQEDHILPEFLKWLRTGYPLTAVQYLPVGMLDKPTRWALQGSQHTILGGLT